ncbi:MAG TPA: NAD(P)-dependent oxidoreductase, partial [bacterium]|nr:NAD(P)-dependent oxidoreductase [bacterium]
MTIVVTGAAGFLGVHLVKELAAADHRVIGVDVTAPDDLVWAYLEPSRHRVRYARADVSVRGSLSDAVDEPVEALVHAAAVTSTPELEASQPQRIVDVNVLGTLEALRFVGAAGIRRFVYLSSSGVYGESSPAEPVLESRRLQLLSLYAMTKFIGERLVAVESREAGYSAASARPAALYGPMERPTGVRTVMSPIYTLIHAAVAKRSVGISRPEVRRDWTYAVDVARGLRLLVEAPGLSYDCYNLSCGKAISLAEIADTLAGIAPGFSWHPAEAGQADIEGARISGRGPLDISRLGEVGFTPQYALSDG